jgi:hypothetical protein
MKSLLMAIAMNLGLLIAVDASAQAPASAPAGSTALCKDGSYSSGTNKRSACRGHKGTKEWFGGGAAATAGAASTPESTRKSKRESKKETASETASAPTAAPAGSTALCKDGSYSSGANKRSACRGHKGTKEWYGAAAAAATTVPAAMPSSAPVTRPTAAPNRGAATVPASERTTVAPGGGAGKVWVNTESKVYHCQSDRYYGKTKHGEYMSEADALAKGNRASGGKSCSQ